MLGQNPISTAPFKVMILSGASFLGQNILDALAPQRKRLKLIGLTSLAHAPSNFAYDRCYLVPPLAEKFDFEAQFLAILAAEKPDLILPGRDDDVVYLSEFREHHPNYAPILPYGSSAIANIIRDKYQAYLWAQTHDLPIARSFRGMDSEALRHFLNQVGFPLIAKPVCGQGSLGVFMIPDAEALPGVLALEDILLQEFLDPPDVFERIPPGCLPLFYHRPDEKHYTLQTLIKPYGQIGPVFAAQSKMLMGRDIEYRQIFTPELDKLAQRFAQALFKSGWIGPVNIQIKPDRQGQWKAHEINLRLSGGTSARTALGHDELGAFIRAFYPQLSWPQLPDSALASENKVTLHRQLQNLLVPDAWPERLEAEGHWTSPKKD